MATVMVRSLDNLQQEIVSGPNVIIADEPLKDGGNDAGFDPYSLLLAALGACTAMTLKIYARNKKWDLQRVFVNLSHDNINAEDCADCETKEGKIDRILRQITFEGNLSEEQTRRLREIAKRCPLHRTLISEFRIEDVP